MHKPTPLPEEIGNPESLAKKPIMTEPAPIQMSMDLGIPELVFNEADKVYMVDNAQVGREEYIKELALAIYEGSDFRDIRGIIDRSVNLTNKPGDLLCFDNKNFVVNVEQKNSHEPLPKHKYEVCFEQRTKPIIASPYLPTFWVKNKIIVEAGNFAEAKEIIRRQAVAEGRTIKNIEIFLVKDQTAYENL